MVTISAPGLPSMTVPTLFAASRNGSSAMWAYLCVVRVLGVTEQLADDGQVETAADADAERKCVADRRARRPALIVLLELRMLADMLPRRERASLGAHRRCRREYQLPLRVLRSRSISSIAGGLSGSRASCVAWCARSA